MERWELQDVLTEARAIWLQRMAEELLSVGELKKRRVLLVLLDLLQSWFGRWYQQSDDMTVSLPAENVAGQVVAWVRYKCKAEGGRLKTLQADASSEDGAAMCVRRRRVYDDACRVMEEAVAEVYAARDKAERKLARKIAAEKKVSETGDKKHAAPVKRGKQDGEEGSAG